MSPWTEFDTGMRSGLQLAHAVVSDDNVRRSLRLLLHCTGCGHDDHHQRQCGVRVDGRTTPQRPGPYKVLGCPCTTYVPPWKETP